MRIVDLPALAGALAPALPLLLDAALKGAVVLGVAGLLSVLLRRHAASLRHAVWTAALLAQLAIPAFSLLLPAWRVELAGAPAWLVRQVAGVPPRNSAPVERAPATLTDPVTQLGEATTQTAARTDALASELGHIAAARSATGPGAPPRTQDRADAPPTRNPSNAHDIAGTPSTTPTTPRDAHGPRPTAHSTNAAVPSSDAPRPTLAYLWIAGALLVLARLALGTVAVSRLAHRGEQVVDGSWLSLTQRLARTLGIRRPLTLLRGGSLGVPVTWGVVYPVVLLPEDADEWSEERRRYVLVHEMAHVKRLDALTQLVAQVAVALFWFNPLVWIAARRMRAEREHACDDYVLRHGTAPSTYATELLEMVRSLGSARRSAQPAFAALAMARRSEFEGRMLSILDPHQDRHPLRRGVSVALASLAALLVLPLAAVTPVRAAPPVVVFNSMEAGRTPVRPETAREQTSMVMQGQTLTITPDSAAVASVPRPAPASAGTLQLVAPRIQIPTPRGPGSMTPMTAVAPVAPVAAPPSGAPTTQVPKPPLPSQYTCDKRHPSGTELSIHDNADEHSRRTTMLVVNDGRCSQVTLTGSITLSADEREIARMTPGSYAFFRERTSTLDRAVTCTPDDRGAPSCRATRNGEPAPFDTVVREWLGRMLPEFAREIGLDVEQRVARIRRQGGVDAVLDEVRRIRSSSSTSAHLAALLDQGNLSDDELSRVVALASQEVKSSGDFSNLLRKMPPRVTQSVAGRRALVAAIDGIPSSGDKTAVVTQYAMQADRELLISLADVAGRIPSSGDRASFLGVTVARYLASHDGRLRTAFFQVVGTMPSSGDRAAVLLQALKFGQGDAEVTRSVIRAVRELPSSGDQSAVLMAVTKQKLLRSELREDFFKSASMIASSTDYRAVMESALP